VLIAAAEAGVPQWSVPRQARPCDPTHRYVYRLQARCGVVSSGVATSTDMLSQPAGSRMCLTTRSSTSGCTSGQGHGVIRLHSPDIAFYVQSALESAQLLLLACLEPPGESSHPRHFRSRLAGEPDGSRARGAGKFGFADAGLRQRIRPRLRGDPVPRPVRPADRRRREPLFNAFEAAVTVDPPCPMLDAFRMDMAPEPRAVKLLSTLAEVCDRSQDPALIRAH